MMFHRAILLITTMMTGAAAMQHARSCSTSVPPPAAAAGYNTLTFGPAINVGRNWFTDTQHGGGAPNIKQHADGSLTVAGGGDTWNGQMQTATETWPGLRGEVFGGGFYAQATISVPGSTANLSSWTGSTTPGNQWPSFWANSIDPVTNAIGIETDIVELDQAPEGVGSSTVINWLRPSGSAPNTGYSQNWTAPNGNTLHGPNTYGMLWIPATATTGGSLTFYLNGQPVGQPITWTRANPGTYGIIDGEKMVLRFGAGPNSPATFSNIEVWQASTAGNLVNGVRAPAIAAGSSCAAAPMVSGPVSGVTAAKPPKQTTPMSSGAPAGSSGPAPAAPDATPSTGTTPPPR